LKFGSQDSFFKEKERREFDERDGDFGIKKKIADYMIALIAQIDDFVI